MSAKDEAAADAFFAAIEECIDAFCAHCWAENIGLGTHMDKVCEDFVTSWSRPIDVVMVRDVLYLHGTDDAAFRVKVTSPESPIPYSAMTAIVNARVWTARLDAHRALVRRMRPTLSARASHVPFARLAFELFRKTAARANVQPGVTETLIRNVVDRVEREERDGDRGAVLVVQLRREISA